MKDKIKMEYIGEYTHGITYKHCFKAHLPGGEYYIYTLYDLINCDPIKDLLEPALACCHFLPGHLTLKEKLAFVQLLS